MKRLVAIATVSLLATHATAGVIVAPISVTSSVGALFSGASEEFMINQTEISVGYTSGVDDFDTIVSTSTLTGSLTIGSASAWFSNELREVPVAIDFDFGTSLNLTRMALWNDIDVQGLGAFSIFASQDASFASLTFLGEFNAVIQPGIGSLPQVFDFDDTHSQYLRVLGAPVMLDPLGSFLQIEEIAFEAEPKISGVPAPATFALLGLGLLGLLRRRPQPNS